MTIEAVVDPMLDGCLFTSRSSRGRALRAPMRMPRGRKSMEDGVSPNRWLAL
jgi:hypothetical protein